MISVQVGKNEDGLKGKVYPVARVSLYTPLSLARPGPIRPPLWPCMAPLFFVREYRADPPDTNHNIKARKEFCVSIISEPFVDASNYTAVDAPYEVDEWKLSGLTKRPSV
jgi:hypothetical protein